MCAFQRLTPRPASYSVADADLTLLALGPAPRRAFAGRSCWVVGASQGLGEALALQLAAQGAHVILSSRRADALQRVAAACLAAGAPRADVVPLDLRAGPVAHAVAAAAAHDAAGAAGVAFLFLAAGGTQRAAAEETSADVDAELLSLNTLSLLSLAKAALPCLRCGPAPGRVVVFSSAAGKLGSPGQAGYAASKHALNGFFSSLRAELAQRNVRVTLLCPGPCATGAPGQARLTFGASLAASQLDAASANAAQPALTAAEATRDARARMAVPRCVRLALAAAAHGVGEAWLARHPVLALLYVNQYAPTLAALALDRVGPKRVEAARLGGSMYSQR